MQSLPISAHGQETKPVIGKDVPSVLSIAGFDPSSGAGFTADLKVFASFGLYGLACPTALTVQSTQGVLRTEPVSPALVAETLACLAADIPIAGVKIGMLGSAAIVAVVASFLRELRGHLPPIPVVLDPVIRSSSGRVLLESMGVDAIRQQLLPLVTVITPNYMEARQLAGEGSEDPGTASGAAGSGMEHVARLLTQTMDQEGAVIVTGGDQTGDAAPADFLLAAGGDHAGTWLRGSWVETTSTHGTGCAFSSALLCGLASGLPIAAAARQAKKYVEGALTAAYRVGRGRGPMHHLFTQIARD